MADKVVALEAADSLGLASNFVPQNNNVVESAEFADMIKANGDSAIYSARFNDIINLTVPYRWDKTTGLGTALAALCGSVQNGYLITEIRVETVYNDWPTITFTAHQHGTNAHAAGNIYTIPADMIAIITGAFGAYDFAGKVGTNVCGLRCTYIIRCNHVDEEGCSGAHFVGTNIHGQEEITCEYIGNAATPTVVAGWTVQDAELNDSNEEHDKSVVHAFRIVLRT